MKTPKKSRPVHFLFEPPTFWKPTQLAEPDANKQARVRLLRIIAIAGKILRYGRSDVQSKFARMAMSHAEKALRLASKDLPWAALELGLIAADSLGMAIAWPALESMNKGTEKNRAMTRDQFEAVKAALKTVEEEFRRPADIFRGSDFKRMNEILRDRGHPTFPNKRLFSKWKSARLKPWARAQLLPKGSVTRTSREK